MYYFAYASNLNRKRMVGLCPDNKPIVAATLHHYQIIFTGWSREWRGAIASIRPIRGGKVRGAIYEVTEKCLNQLDRDAGSDYRRLNVIVNNEDNEPMEAVTYINQKANQETKPSPQYLAVIQQGYKDWRLF